MRHREADMKKRFVYTLRKEGKLYGVRDEETLFSLIRKKTAVASDEIYCNRRAIWACVGELPETRHLFPPEDLNVMKKASCAERAQKEGESGIHPDPDVDGAELEVIFWDKVFQGLERKLPMPGKTISALGRVDVYKDKIQLKVWEAADLREVTEKKPPVSDGTITPIASITAEQKGAMFTVVGTLGEPRSIPGGVIYPIDDDSGEMVVLFWDKKVSGEERDALESGVRLRVTAPLVVYKGTLELVPEDVGAFHVEEPK